MCIFLPFTDLILLGEFYFPCEGFQYCSNLWTLLVRLSSSLSLVSCCLSPFQDVPKGACVACLKSNRMNVGELNTSIFTMSGETFNNDSGKGKKLK